MGSAGLRASNSSTCPPAPIAFPHSSPSRTNVVRTTTAPVVVALTRVAKSLSFQASRLISSRGGTHLPSTCAPLAVSTARPL